MAIPHFDASDDKESENPPSNNFKLVLQSAVCHRGQYVDSGHYVSLVRTAGSGENSVCSGDSQHSDQNTDTWVLFDDLAYDRVKTVNIKRALSEESPYLLFYKVQPIDEPDSSFLPPYEQSEGSTDALDEKLSNLSNASAGGRSRESMEVADLQSRRPSTDATSPDATSPDDIRGRTSLSSPRRASVQFQVARGTSTNGSIMTDQVSLEHVGTVDELKPSPISLSRQSTRGRNGGGEGGNEKRFSMSMGRFTSKLNRDKSAYPEIVVDEVREETVIVSPTPKEESPEGPKSKPKEKRRKFGTVSRRGSGGGQKSGKPERDCIVM